MIRREQFQRKNSREAQQDANFRRLSAGCMKLSAKNQQHMIKNQPPQHLQYSPPNVTKMQLSTQLAESDQSGSKMDSPMVGGVAFRGQIDSNMSRRTGTQMQQEHEENPNNFHQSQQENAAHRSLLRKIGGNTRVGGSPNQNDEFFNYERNVNMYDRNLTAEDVMYANTGEAAFGGNLAFEQQNRGSHLCKRAHKYDNPDLIECTFQPALHEPLGVEQALKSGDPYVQRHGFSPIKTITQHPVTKLSIKHHFRRISHAREGPKVYRQRPSHRSSLYEGNKGAKKEVLNNYEQNQINALEKLYENRQFNNLGGEFQEKKALKINSINSPLENNQKPYQKRLLTKDIQGRTIENRVDPNLLDIENSLMFNSSRFNSINTTKSRQERGLASFDDTSQMTQASKTLSTFFGREKRAQTFKPKPQKNVYSQNSVTQRFTNKTRKDTTQKQVNQTTRNQQFKGRPQQQLGFDLDDKNLMGSVSSLQQSLWSSNMGRNQRRSRMMNSAYNSTFASIDDFKGDIKTSEDHVQLMLNRRGSDDKIIRGVPNLFPSKKVQNQEQITGNEIELQPDWMKPILHVNSHTESNFASEVHGFDLQNHLEKNENLKAMLQLDKQKEHVDLMLKKEFHSRYACHMDVNDKNFDKFAYTTHANGPQKKINLQIRRSFDPSRTTNTSRSMFQKSNSIKQPSQRLIQRIFNESQDLKGKFSNMRNKMSMGQTFEDEKFQILPVQENGEVVQISEMIKSRAQSSYVGQNLSPQSRNKVVLQLISNKPASKKTPKKRKNNTMMNFHAASGSELEMESPQKKQENQAKSQMAQSPRSVEAKNEIPDAALFKYPHGYFDFTQFRGLDTTQAQKIEKQHRIYLESRTKNEKNMNLQEDNGEIKAKSIVPELNLQNIDDPSKDQSSKNVNPYGMDGVLNLSFFDFMILHRLFPQVFIMNFDEHNVPKAIFKDELSPKSGASTSKSKDKTQNNYRRQVTQKQVNFKKQPTLVNRKNISPQTKASLDRTGTIQPHIHKQITKGFSQVSSYLVDQKSIDSQIELQVTSEREETVEQPEGTILNQTLSFNSKEQDSKQQVVKVAIKDSSTNVERLKPKSGFSVGSTTKARSNVVKTEPPADATKFESFVSKYSQLLRSDKLERSALMIKQGFSLFDQNQKAINSLRHNQVILNIARNKYSDAYNLSKELYKTRKDQLMVRSPEQRQIILQPNEQEKFALLQNLIICGMICESQKPSRTRMNELIDILKAEKFLNPRYTASSTELNVFKLAGYVKIYQTQKQKERQLKKLQGLEDSPPSEVEKENKFDEKGKKVQRESTKIEQKDAVEIAKNLPEAVDEQDLKQKIKEIKQFVDLQEQEKNVEIDFSKHFTRTYNGIQKANVHPLMTVQQRLNFLQKYAPLMPEISPTKAQDLMFMEQVDQENDYQLIYSENQDAALRASLEAQQIFDYEEIEATEFNKHMQRRRARKQQFYANQAILSDNYKLEKSQTPKYAPENILGEDPTFQKDSSHINEHKVSADAYREMTPGFKGQKPQTPMDMKAKQTLAVNSRTQRQTPIQQFTSKNGPQRLKLQDAIKQNQQMSNSDDQSPLQKMPLSEADSIFDDNVILQEHHLKMAAKPGGEPVTITDQSGFTYQYRASDSTSQLQHSTIHQPVPNDSHDNTPEGQTNHVKELLKKDKQMEVKEKPKLLGVDLSSLYQYKNAGHVVGVEPKFVQKLVQKQKEAEERTMEFRKFHLRNIRQIPGQPLLTREQSEMNFQEKMAGHDKRIVAMQAIFEEILKRNRYRVKNVDPVEEEFKVIALQVQKLCSDPSIVQGLLEHLREERLVREGILHRSKIPKRTVPMDVLIHATKELIESEKIEFKEKNIPLLQAKIDQVRLMFIDKEELQRINAQKAKLKNVPQVMDSFLSNTMETGRQSQVTSGTGGEI